MTVLECLNTRPAAFHPSPLRAPARSAEVRSNSDPYRNNTRPKMQSGPAFSPGIGDRAAQTVATSTYNLQTDQLLAIEIP